MIFYNYFTDTDFISQILLPGDIIYNLTNNFFQIIFNKILKHDIINYSAMIVIIEEKKEIMFLLGGYRYPREMV